MANSDFMSWDDIDLDFLLEEYTDYENNEGHESSVLKAKPTDETNDLCVYVCPDCSKELKSISGFRGHVTKKHGREFMKASDHRKTTSQSTNKQSVEKKAHVEKTPFMPEGVYNNIYVKSYMDAINCIKDDPLHNLFGTSPISEIAQFCENNIEIRTMLQKEFSTVVLKPMNVSSAADREALFRELHCVRLGSNITDMCTYLKSLKCPQKESITDFLQVLLIELTNSILINYKEHMQSSSSAEEKAMTDTEQKSLYYISGYILHSLKKKYNHLKPSEVKDKKVANVNNWQCEKNDAAYICKLASWVEKRNRGGLKHPCDNFFLLIRTMENIIKKTVATDLTANSLRKSKLKERILEDYMIKVYTEKLSLKSEDCLSDNEDDKGDDEGASVSAVIVEDIIGLFLTVRGNAVTRVERNKLVQSKEKQKTGDSFRQVLKSKSVKLQNQ